MTIRRSFSAMLGIALSIGTFAGLVALTEEPAEACGGCFHPVGETPTVVTDHRMIFSISKTQSTLYDQIRYSGSPKDFAWILPISGSVDVGLSADVVFNALDRLTTTQLMPPPMNCPAPPDDCAQSESSRGGGNFSPSADAGSTGVNVIKREEVGPYETVQLGATDPAELKNWLIANGYSLPPEIVPVVDAYVAASFNFLALKLKPGQGVQDMRPVRVTSTGANAVLPLRMVAAGTGATVGISLWVVSEGRYEPQNFPSFYIATDELQWTWSQSRSNYTDLRAAKTAAGGGRAWETESSVALNRPQLESMMQQLSFGFGGPFGQDAGTYLPVTNDAGAVVETPTQVQEEDMNTLFAGIANGRVSRLRADLSKQALDQDLVMQASADQAELPTTRQVLRETDQPQCPVFNGCSQTGTLPRDEAVKANANNAGSVGGGTFTCNNVASAKTSYRSALLSLGAGFGAIAMARAIRRRRRK